MQVISSIIGLLLGGVAVAASQVRNAELGYSLTPPHGFRDYPEGRSQKDVVDSWIEAPPAGADGAVIVFVQRMHGVLPREPLRQQDLPESAQVVTFKWQGFDIDGLTVQTSKDGIRVFVLAAQVPLRREAVQLVVSGPADQAARGPAIMTATLAALEGETNWLTATERASRLGTIAGWWIGIGAAVIAALFWRRRRRAKSA